MGLNVKAVATGLERVFTTENGAKWVREVAEDGARKYTNTVTNKTIKFGGTKGKFFQFGNSRIYDPGITGYSISSNGYTNYYVMSNRGKRIYKGIKKDGQNEFIKENMFALDSHGNVSEFWSNINGDRKCGALGRATFWDATPARIYKEVGGVRSSIQGSFDRPLWTGLQGALRDPFYKPY